MWAGLHCRVVERYGPPFNVFKPGSSAAQVVVEARALIAGQWNLFAAAFAVAALLLVADRLLRPTRLRQPVQWLVLFGATFVGLRMALAKAWLSDDGFISFRYADNFARGRGLVFNEGEWVEGYTNFLWTWLLGLSAKLGADIPFAALSGTLFAYAMTVFLSAAIVVKASRQPLAVPFAALALAVGYTLTTWATSGLETLPAAFAALLGGYFLLTDDRAAYFKASVAFAAAALLRPDHVLFFAAAAFAIAVFERRRDKRLRVDRYIAFVAPFVLIYGLFFLWRWRTYGDLYPNTYYAKSGGTSYASQGTVYLLVFLATTGAWAWAFLPALVGRWRGLHPDAQRFGLFALVGTVGFSAYVVRVGGDFMLNRFFVSALPLMATATEIGLRQRLSDVRWRAPLNWVAGAVAAAAFAAAVVPVPLISRWEKKWHIAAEESFYKISGWRPLVVDSPYFVRGLQLADDFSSRGLSPKVAEGCVGMVAYYSDLPVVDRFGLTNKRIARMPIQTRGRPGHEKLGGLEDVLAEGAVFSLEPLWPGRAREAAFAVGGHPYFLLRWDDAFISSLKTLPDARVPDIEALAEEAAASRDVIALTQSLQFYDRFLSGSMLQASVVDRFRKRMRFVETSLRPILTFAFEEQTWPSQFTVTGSAFGAGPARGTLLMQQPVSGIIGAGFVNSFHGGDGATGMLEIPLKGTGELRLQVGGGKDCERVYAAVRVDGKVLSRACGQNDEVMRNVVLAVPPGEDATLVVVDNATGPWGHIEIDHALLLPVEDRAAAEQ